jgi:hypothetical protein
MTVTILKRDNEDIMSQTVTLSLSLFCTVCGSRLQTLVYSDKVRVVPCEGCIVNRSTEEMKNHLGKIQADDAKAWKTVKDERQKLHDIIEASIRNEYLQKFSAFIRSNCP